MLERSGKTVDIRNSFSTHPCLPFLLVFLGPWTVQSMGLSFLLLPRKRFGLKCLEIPLTLIFCGEIFISITIIWMFETPQTLSGPHTERPARKRKMNRVMFCARKQT